VSQRAQRAPVPERPNDSEGCGVPPGYTGRRCHVVERGVRHIAQRVGGRSASQRCEMAIMGRVRDRRYERSCPSRHVAC
jgi:hypothetical protein